MNAITVMRMGERLVAVKTADAAGADPLRSEARILELLDHPGLVQFVDVDDGDESVVMRTAFAGADTWASRPVDDPVERAAGIAAIAATVADLHARGVTHGALRLARFSNTKCMSVPIVHSPWCCSSQPVNSLN